MVEVAVRIDRHDGSQPMLQQKVIERSVLGRRGVACIDDGTRVCFVANDIGILADGVKGQCRNLHKIRFGDKDRQNLPR